jgi:hypothetical protein
MATRSALLIRTETGDWLSHYCHFDGYPEHMLPALASADPAAILRGGEIRQIHANGTVEAFEKPRAVFRLSLPVWPEWAAHVYVLTADGWVHAATPEELAAIVMA